MEKNLLCDRLDSLMKHLSLKLLEAEFRKLQLSEEKYHLIALK